MRDHHIEHCEPPALALYLFLITVADAKGLSYYADDSTSRLLSLTPDQLRRARQTLIRTELIVYEPPLYQVLALDLPKKITRPSEPSSRTQAVGELRSLRDLLRHSPGASS